MSDIQPLFIVSRGFLKLWSSTVNITQNGSHHALPFAKLCMSLASSSRPHLHYVCREPERPSTIRVSLLKTQPHAMPWGQLRCHLPRGPAPYRDKQCERQTILSLHFCCCELHTVLTRTPPEYKVALSSKTLISVIKQIIFPLESV